MMHWEMWQWVVLIVPNTVTAIAYELIPRSLGRKQTDITREKNLFLFKAFIRGCSHHHLWHYPLMFYAMFNPLYAFLLLAIIDWTLAAISVLAAKEVDFG